MKKEIIKIVFEDKKWKNLSRRMGIGIAVGVITVGGLAVIFIPWIVGSVLVFLINILFGRGLDFSFGMKWLIGLLLCVLSGMISR